MTDIVWSLRAALLIAEAFEAAKEIERLRAALEAIDEELNDAAQDDCESGVKWLNERAAEGYLKEYPHTSAAISKVINLIRAELGGGGQVIRPDQIPPEAVKAAWQALMAPDALAMHRAIAAAINAWPDVELDRECLCYFGENIILPLPQEGEA